MRSTSPETKNSGDLCFVPIESLNPFPNHPFKLYEGDKLDELIESIKEIGIVNAIIIRKDPMNNNQYQILSGHNRVNAARIAGLKQVKAEIIDVDDDTAAIIVVDSNFKQRHSLLPSERAYGFKMQLDALKRQGKRTDLFEDENSSIKSRDIIGNQHGISGVQVYKYIRLTELIPELINLLDLGKINIKTGFEISYISKEFQLLIYTYLSENNLKRIDNDKALFLKKEFVNQGCLTIEKINQVFSDKKNIRVKSLSLKRSDLLKFFPDSMSNEEIIKKIFNLLQKEDITN